jgi:fumarate reductase flavoprotein subunit
MKKVEADVVVTAAGPSGLAAAIAAAEGGASVIAFEKLGRTGGIAIGANQVFGVESRLQRIRQYTLSREKAFNIWMEFNQWGVNARLVKKYIDKSASTLDWLEKMGVQFCDLTSHGPGNNYTSHVVWEKTHRPGMGAVATMIDIMTARAKELGVQIFLKTLVKQVLKKGNRIVGVIAEDKNGQTIQANAKAVIIGTGGTVGYMGLSSGGDGIRMAKEVGAEVAESTMEKPGRGGGLQGPRNSDDPTAIVVAVFNYPHLMVNLLGERFMDEEANVFTQFGSNAIALQKNHCAFCIFDEDTKSYFMETGLEFPLGFGIVQFREPITEIKDFDANFKQLIKGGSETVFVADSLKELAGKTGISLEGLKKTLEEYNKACETGRDEAFNKKTRYLRTVKKPRFYASKRSVPGMGTQEGIKINHKTEVLTKEFEVIPGLYAVGSDARCNIHRNIYTGVLPGSGLGWAINSGRMAAENAIEYIKTIKPYAEIKPK